MDCAHCGWSQQAWGTAAPKTEHLQLFHCCIQRTNSPETSTYLVWLLMLQKHMQKPITYLITILRLVTRARTQALIPQHCSFAVEAFSSLLFCLPAAPDQMHWVPALENYRCTLLLQGVLSSGRPRSTVVLMVRTALSVLQLCAIFSSPSPQLCAIFRSPSPRRWPEAQSSGWCSLNVCERAPHGGTGGWRQASEL